MDVEEIRTARLVLKQLHTNDLGSEDLECYHRIWSDELATQWSYHGPCKTKEASQQWMAGVLPRSATGNQVKVAFAVWPMTTTASGTPDSQAVGILTLLSTAFRLASETTTTTAAAADPEDGGAVVELGYLFHPDSWGRGYATESLRALLEAYVQQRAARSPDAPFEIRASAHSENRASVRVLEKLGFEELGRFEHEGRLPLRKETSKDVVLHLRLKR